MGSKKNRNKQDKSNLVDIQVKGTIYKIHPAVMEGVQNLNNQYNGLLSEYKTVLSMNQASTGQFRRFLNLFDSDNVTEDQKNFILEIKELVEGVDQKRNDVHYEKMNPRPTEGPQTEAEAAVAAQWSLSRGGVDLPKKLIKESPDDTLFSLYDCHI